MSKPILHLLPSPKRVSVVPGTARLSQTSEWKCLCADTRVTDAMQALRAKLPGHSPASAITVTVAVDLGVALPSEGYQLTIGTSGISISSRTPAGCFYGLQTLEQLIDFATAHVPCCSITDWPDFATRGLLHDVTRGKVPTLATLKYMVDRLAALKINQFQLYIEHAFVFSFDPDICAADEGLTPDEIRELDDYCRRRFIDLVPSMANLGHMGRILTMPRYRHLAEIEPVLDWSRMSWPQRLRGCTLDAAHPQGWALVERMWTDVLAAFSSPVVNICGDEPWDLGEGKNKERCLREGKSELYLSHLRRLQEFCAGKGRVTQFWGDVVRNYPHLLDRLRPDGAILHWGYDDRSDYEGTATFVRSGLPTLVCPGTSGWKRTLNGINLAERNIQTFATAALRHGASGLLNTDWGDHGHFNALAASWHGITWGACCAWRTDHVGGADFDGPFLRRTWNIQDAGTGKLLRAAARLSDDCETWRMLWMPVQSVAQEATFPSVESAQSAQAAAEALVSELRAIMTGPLTKGFTTEAVQDLRELALAAEFTGLSAEKCVLVRGSADAGGDGATLRRRWNDWADHVRSASSRFAQEWRMRNKPMRLPDIDMALQVAVADATSH